MKRRAFLTGMAAILAAKTAPAAIGSSILMPVRPIETIDEWADMRFVAQDYQLRWWEQIQCVPPGRIVVVQTRHHISDLYRAVR